MLEKLNIIIKSLDNLDWQGEKEDVPQGSRYATFSYTAIKMIQSDLIDIAHHLEKLERQGREGTHAN